MTKPTAGCLVYWLELLDNVTVCIWSHSDHMPLLPTKPILWLHWLQREKIVSSIQWEISFCSWQRNSPTSGWGQEEVTVDDIQASTKAKFPRNKYMGMWRWRSLHKRAIRPRCPIAVMRYITKNTSNKGICHFCWYVSPMKINSISNIAFSFSISSLGSVWNTWSKWKE